MYGILAEGAIALSVTLCGGALFATRKLFKFPSSLVAKVIPANFMWASAQQSGTIIAMNVLGQQSCARATCCLALRILLQLRDVTLPCVIHTFPVIWLR
jgi:hypothetical protein